MDFCTRQHSHNSVSQIKQVIWCLATLTGAAPFQIRAGSGPGSGQGQVYCQSLTALFFFCFFLVRFIDREINAGSHPLTIYQKHTVTQPITNCQSYKLEYPRESILGLVSRSCSGGEYTFLWRRDDMSLFGI